MQITPERFVLVALALAVTALMYLHFREPLPGYKQEARSAPSLSGGASSDSWAQLEARLERRRMEDRIDCVERKAASEKPYYISC